MTSIGADGPLLVITFRRVTFAGWPTIISGGAFVAPKLTIRRSAFALTRVDSLFWSLLASRSLRSESAVAVFVIVSGAPLLWTRSRAIETVIVNVFSSSSARLPRPQVSVPVGDSVHGIELDW